MVKVQSYSEIKLLKLHETINYSSELKQLINDYKNDISLINDDPSNLDSFLKLSHKTLFDVITDYVLRLATEFNEVNLNDSKGLFNFLINPNKLKPFYNEVVNAIFKDSSDLIADELFNFYCGQLIIVKNGSLSWVLKRLRKQGE